MLARSLRRPVRDEGGFTLVEILFATVILFVVATALLGLAGASTMSAATAKEKTLLVNAVNSYMEEIKSMDFGDVGTSTPGTGTVTGTLPTVETLTIEGFQLTMTLEVTWVDDPNIDGSQDYKLLTVTASAVPINGGDPIVFVTETQLRDQSIGWGFDDYGGSAEVPEVEFFDAESPVEGAVVQGTVRVRATASHPMENGLLDELNMFWGTGRLYSYDGTDAYWVIAAQTADEYFDWDTTYTYTNPEWPYNTIVQHPDGTRQLRVEVTDNLGQRVWRTRTVTVDNSAPEVPEAPWVEWQTGETVRWAWNAAADGPVDFASSYEVGVDEDLGSVWAHQHDAEGRCGSDIADLFYEMRVLSQVAENQPDRGFRRFRVRLYAESPNFQAGYSTPHAESAPTVTPPLMNGEYSVTFVQEKNSASGETYNSLFWASPKFPVKTDAVTYILWRSTSADMSGATAELTTSNMGETYFTDHIVDSGNKHWRPTAYYYQLQATVTPTGVDSDGQPVTVWSNVAGPNGVVTGSGEMAVTW